ncbi:MFS transporter [Ensifer adhaerens]|uniref:MFS transporter n=1 Tax=Ensifer adhaerens TaxID=106592 RepID=UPI0023A9CEED|nr:MFS transporter [Ensifer adhaerens]WDZ76246.1 MFS transporter [Ensifer adhaerens]
MGFLRPKFAAGNVALLLNTVLLQFVVYALRLATVYRTVELSLPAVWLGIIAGCFALLPVFLALPAGRWVDRGGELWVLQSGNWCVALSALGFWLFGDNAIGLLLLTVTLGIGHTLATVSQQAVAVSKPAKRQDRQIGHYTLAVSLGQIASPLLVLLGQRPESGIPHMQPVFLAALVLAGASAASGRFVSGTPHVGEAACSRSAEINEILRLKKMPLLIVTGALGLSASDLLMIYIPVLGLERGIGPEAVSLILSVRACAVVLSRALFSQLLNLLGTNRNLLIASQFTAFAGVGSLLLPLGACGMAVAVFVSGFGIGVSQPLTIAWVSQITPKHMLGTALSLRLTGNRAGQLVIPGLSGLLATFAGPISVFATTAAAFIALSLWSARL